jgi:hypothetical protein
MAIQGATMPEMSRPGSLRLRLAMTAAGESEAIN